MNDKAGFLWTTPAGRVLFLLIVVASTIMPATLGHQYMTDITDVFSVGTLMAILATGLPVALATLHLRMRNETWRRFGLRRPDSWLTLAIQVVLVTVAVLLFFRYAIQPIAQWTGARPDVSHIMSLRGNLPGLIWALTVVWITAAFFEEMFVRGYLLNEISDLLGGSAAALVTGAVLSSFIFGFGHVYQGLSGIIVTGMAGLILAVAYLLCRRNLWPVIIAHGLINSYQLIRVYNMPPA